MIKLLTYITFIIVCFGMSYYDIRHEQTAFSLLWFLLGVILVKNAVDELFRG